MCGEGVAAGVACGMAAAWRKMESLMWRRNVSGNVAYHRLAKSKMAMKNTAWKGQCENVKTKESGEIVSSGISQRQYYGESETLTAVISTAYVNIQAINGVSGIRQWQCESSAAMADNNGEK